jgi:serine/threonine protein kinase
LCYLLIILTHKLQANVLIDKDGIAQIGDFGISRLMEDDMDTGMTTTTPHFGTVRYLAPELVDPGKAFPSRPSDVWALGCVAHEVRFTPASEIGRLTVKWHRLVHLPSSSLCRH